MAKHGSEYKQSEEELAGDIQVLAFGARSRQVANGSEGLRIGLDRVKVWLGSAQLSSHKLTLTNVDQ